jgi:predicted Na+-dependent transporter
MPDALDAIFTALIAVTVFLTALAIGLETSLTALRKSVRRRSLALVLAANLLVVPSAGVVIARLLPLSPESETGILLCAICAAGPLGIKAAQIARSDLSWALSLTVLLLLLNLVSLPVWTALLFDRSLSLRSSDLVGVMIVVILVPFATGAAIRKWRGGQDDHWAARAATISNVTLVLAVLAGMVGNAGQLATALSSWVLVAAGTIIGAAGLIGLAAPGEPDVRRTSTLITINRATSLALLVAGRSFPENGEVFTAVVVFGLAQTAFVLAVSLAWGRRPVRAIPEPAV